MRGDALPAITIAPNPALTDEFVYTRQLGFTPGQRVRLRVAGLLQALMEP